MSPVHRSRWPLTSLAKYLLIWRIFSSCLIHIPPSSAGPKIFLRTSFSNTFIFILLSCRESIFLTHTLRRDVGYNWFVEFWVSSNMANVLKSSVISLLQAKKSFYLLWSICFVSLVFLNYYLKVSLLELYFTFSILSKLWLPLVW